MHKNLSGILSKLTLSDKENTAKNICSFYKTNGACIVHFLYFANIVLNGLDNDTSVHPKKEPFSKALLGGDFLLPDGIALRLLQKKYFNKELPNLNGTDFLPYFFTRLPEDKKVEILLYGSTNETMEKSSEYITKTFGFPVVSAQNGFGEFDWSGIGPRKEGYVRILLVARGTPRR